MAPPSGVKVELDRPRTLRYTNRSLVKLEDESGLTASELVQRIAAGSMKALSQLVWAGLLHESPTLTVEEVLDWIDIERLDEIATAVGTAVEQAFGQPEAGAEGKAEAASAS